MNGLQEKNGLRKMPIFLSNNWETIGTSPAV
jgi:hypothetical protein